MQFYKMITECSVFRGKNIEIPESRVSKKQEKCGAQYNPLSDMSTI